MGLEHIGGFGGIQRDEWTGERGQVAKGERKTLEIRGENKGVGGRKGQITDREDEREREREGTLRNYRSDEAM